MTKMMVVTIALLFAAALLVAPAAARGSPGINDIQSGETIFEHERGLNLSALDSAITGTITGLRMHTDDDVKKGERNFIPVTPTTMTNIDILSSLVNGYYGQYFVSNATGSDASVSIYIRKPTATLDVVLEDDHSSSVDGDSISKTTQIAFKTEAPMVATYYNNAAISANVTIEFTTPGGAKITTFGNTKSDGTGDAVSFKDIRLTAGQLFNATYPADTEAGTYTAQVKWAYPSAFADYAAKSNTVSFTIDTRTVSIVSNKDNVIRGNNFVATITGESQTPYYVYVQSADDKSPTVRAGQPSVNVTDAALAEMASKSLSSYENKSAAIVTTNAAGTRPIEFETTTTTEEKTYTIRVTSTDKAKYDTVKVKVEKGSVTITASGDRTYYIGEEITFSGTNTDSDTVYLFVTGPNLASKDGVKADAPSTKTVTDNATTFKTVAVESDDTWEWKFDTQGYAVDAGTYTYYAVTAAKNRANLADAQYATISVVLRKGFVSSSASSTTVAKGDKLFIRGNAQGNPNDVAIWIVGTNHLVRATESVNDDSSFEYELKSEATKDLAAGQYFVIVQHPMGDAKFNVVKDDKPNRVSILGTTGEGTNGFIYTGDGRLQGSDAAQALIDLLNNQNVDDTYNKLTFLVQEPWIRIDTISDKYVGTTFTITGTTNLGVDNEILVDVKSSAFQPTEKTASGEFSGDAGTVKVVAGDAGYNTWSFDVNAAAFKADEYIVKVESIESDTTATATFNVLEGVPVTPTPATPVPTTPPATQPPATTPPATPASPGFGALVAIAGLGAVAFLVLRRD